jgi:cell division protein ZipA
MKITTATETQQRVASLMSTKGSEDASSLLVRPTLPKRSFDVAPIDNVDWVFDIRAESQWSSIEVDSVFSREWLEIHGHYDLKVLGFSSEIRAWMFALASDAPSKFERLCIAISLVPFDGKLVTAQHLASMAAAIGAAVQKRGAHAQSRSTATSALLRARHFAELRKELGDAKVSVVLVAPQRTYYDGKKVWDVMMSLGLQWGDGDLFHWTNESGAIGDDQLFSVSTDNEPGYFLPESIAAGTTAVDTLVFEFEIPRSADSRAALEGVLAAAAYAQQRLGGVLVDRCQRNGSIVSGSNASPKSLDVAVLRKFVAKIAARLHEVGCSPLDLSTLRIF